MSSSFKKIRPKKRFGQHFLSNEDIAKQIVQHVKDYSYLIEIGPGKGILTKYLLEQNAHLKVIEIDRDCCKILQETFPSIERKLINQDFLKVDIRAFFPDKTFSIIGNFPYNISTQIIFKILDHPDLITSMVGMFQKEVAERICAKHGSKVYGVTSVLTQYFYHAQYLFTVEACEFEPPPKVTSAVMRLDRKKEAGSEIEYKQLRTVVKLAFNQRRKTLRNSLKSLPILPDVFAPFLAKRPEQLSLEDFILLANALI